MEKPTLEDKSNFSNSLYDQTGEYSSDSDFETPPKPVRPIEIRKKSKSKPLSTVTKATTNNTNNQKENMQWALNDDNNTDIEVKSADGLSNSKNILQMYKQNSIGLFVGANLTNCTININIPK